MIVLHESAANIYLHSTIGRVESCKVVFFLYKKSEFFNI